MSVGCPQSHMTSCPNIYTNHITMYINQTVACVVPSMNHCVEPPVGVDGELLLISVSVTHLIVFWLPPPIENV